MSGGGAGAPGGSTLLDGKAVAAGIRARLAAEVAADGRGGGGTPPATLATVLVGDDPASHRYVASKGRQARAVGLGARHVGLPAAATQAQVEEAVAGLARDPSVHGILVQLPLPPHLDPAPVLDLLPPDKDVDGLTETNLGRLALGDPGHRPCTPRGVMALLDAYRVPVTGRRAVVVGRSLLVGRPLTLLLAGAGAVVTQAHSGTSALASVTREADLLVSATGSPGVIRAGHVRPGATVVDVGISRTEAGLVGDVAFAEVAEVAGALSPVPGGVGPMTVACLLENTLEAARRQGAAP